jgi:hypothetical protein
MKVGTPAEMMHTIATATASGGTKIPWYEVVTGIIAIPAALLTIYGGVIVSRKTRLESRKLELEIAAEEGKQAANASTPGPAIAPADRSSRAIAISIEGYVIRFILLYLTYEIVGFLLQAIEPLLNSSVYFFNTYSPVEEFAINVSGAYLDLIVNVFVFLLLGLPLFRDILGSLGLRSNQIFSRELRKRSVPKE